MRRWRRSERWGGGGFRDAAGRMFSESPLRWALPLYTAFGIRVRVHLVFLLWIGAELLVAWLGPRNGLGIGYVAMAIAALFGLVLLHEYGHCFACRRVGGEATDILMWPLGGLAECMPPERWRAHLWTVVGGPAVNALLVPVFGGALLAVGAGWHAVVFNPFDPGSAAGALSSWGVVALWWLHYTNLVLLAFNVLVPMYPMDGGRILQALLWSRIGWERSLVIAARVGLIAAVTMLVFAMVTAQQMLMGIALFGGIVCWMELRRLSAPEELGGPSIDLSAAFDHPDRPRDAGVRAGEREEMDEEQADSKEVDRILEKIARSGMGSLSRKERKILQQETERRRGSSV